MITIYSSCNANDINLEENDYNLFILQCKRNIPWRKWLHFRIRRHLTVFVHMMSLVTTMTKMKTIDLLNTVWPEPLLCLLWPITLSWLNNHRVQIKMAVAMVVVVVILFMRFILFFCDCFIGCIGAFIYVVSGLRKGVEYYNFVLSEQSSNQSDSYHGCNQWSGNRYHEYKLQNILGFDWHKSSKNFFF